MASNFTDNAERKSFKIFEKDEPQETIFVDLEQRIHPSQQKLLFKHGQNVKNLDITCKHKQAQRHMILTEILKKCPNLEKIRMSFHHFDTTQTEIEKGSRSINDDEDALQFQCPIKLEKLFSFEFKAIFTVEEVSGTNPKYKAVSFYMNLFTKIIMASENLKHLAVCTFALNEFVKEMHRNALVAHKLTQLHTLLLINCPVPAETHVLYHVDLSLYQLLLIASPLEVLHIGGVPWADLSHFPALSELRTLSMQWGCEGLRMAFPSAGLPRLNTLILSELDPTKYPIYLDFQWPFQKISEEMGLRELEWDEKMKSLKFDSTDDDERNLSPNFGNLFQDLQSSSTTDSFLDGPGGQPVNLIIYFNKDQAIITRAWLNRLLIELHNGGLNVKTCFIDLKRIAKKDVDLKQDCVLRCHGFNQSAPAFHRVVVRASEDQPAEVFNFRFAFQNGL